MLRELIAILFLMPLLHEPIQHGTCVLTLSTMDIIVVAADGNTHLELPTGKPDAPYLRATEQGESKVVICGSNFLCATAGLNPLIYKRHGLDIEYDFQKWIASIPAKKHSSVVEYANAIQRRERKTFREADALLQQPDFWNSQSAAMAALVVFRVVGFTDEGPEFCDMALKIDREHRRAIFADPECSIRKTPSMHYSSLWGTHHTNSDTAWINGSPQSKRLMEIQPSSLATARVLLPDSRPAIQAIVANAASLIRVESEFDPQEVGGTPNIGILEKGKCPKTLFFAPLNH